MNDEGEPLKIATDGSSGLHGARTMGGWSAVFEDSQVFADAREGVDARLAEMMAVRTAIYQAPLWG